MNTENLTRASSAEIKKLCILIVHDDRMTRHALQQRFDSESSLTYSVETTETASDGIALVRSLHHSRLPVALVLVQDTLPDLSLEDFFTNIEEVDPEIRKIILISGKLSIEGLNRLSDITHFDGFLPEPETHPEFAPRIRRSVDRYRRSLDLHRRVDLFHRLHRSAEKLMDQIHFISLAENILHEVLRSTGAQVATLITYSYSNQTTIYRGSLQMHNFLFGSIKADKFEEELPIFLLSLLLENKQPIHSGHATDDDFGLQDPYILHHKTKSIYATPLVSGKTLNGILIVEQRTHYDYFTNEYLDFLEMFARMVSSALSNALLYLSVEQQVDERANRLMEQRQHISNNDQVIRESLGLARRIQASLMPAAHKLQEHFPDSFVLYQPKYAVSGDFYWFASIQKKQVIICADCSGRGVPGAFLSFIGINTLNRIIKEYRILDPARILTEVDIELKRVFHTGLAASDVQEVTIDMMIAVVDRKYMTLEWAGADSKMYHVREKQLQVLRGDRQSTGGIESHANSFTQSVLELKPNDRLYLSTDGFAAQFGGPNGKKFLYKRLQQTLVDLQDYPMPLQNVHLVRSLSQWKGANEQTDDMLMLAVEVQPTPSNNPDE